MDRLASLQKRAADTQRRLFASLPFYVRLAYVFARLANLPLQSLGRTLGAVFIVKKVEGLPDVKGQPALEWGAAFGADINKITRMLPPNYLEAWVANEVRNRLMAKFKNEDLVADAISGWLLRFVVNGGMKNMDEGMPLTSARNYVLTGIQNESLNQIKKRNRHREDSMNETDDDGRATMQIDDPKALRSLVKEDRHLWKFPRVRRILEQDAHPDAPLFLDLLMDGYTVNEIVGDWRKATPAADAINAAGGHVTPKDILDTRKPIVTLLRGADPTQSHHLTEVIEHARKEGTSMLPHLQAKPITPQMWEYKVKPRIYKVLQDAADYEMV